MSLIRFHPVILGKGRGPGILRGNGQPGHTSIADLIKYTLCLFRRHSRYYHNHVVRCCVYDSDYESDEESESEKSTMYT